MAVAQTRLGPPPQRPDPVDIVADAWDYYRWVRATGPTGRPMR
ncbi:hypothetical protein ACRS6B_29165 [Nocardia asteroides]